jgi:hypothetical protein
MATLKGTGVTTPTPPTPPLTLDASASTWGEPRGGRVKVYAYTNHDSTVVVRGRKFERAKEGAEPLKYVADDAVARYRAVISVKPRHPSRLDLPGSLTTKIKVTATDEFGQRATDEFAKRFALLPWP